MTVDEVVTAFSGAEKIDYGDTLGPLNPASELVRLSGWTLKDKPFLVGFYFSDETHGLSRVILSPQNDLPFSELEPLAASLIEDFRAQYGKEASYEPVSPSQPVPKLEATWKTDTLAVTVVAFDVGGTAAVLNVTYGIPKEM